MLVRTSRVSSSRSSTGTTIGRLGAARTVQHQLQRHFKNPDRLAAAHNPIADRRAAIVTL
jgi:hypothetical protein